MALHSSLLVFTMISVFLATLQVSAASNDRYDWSSRIAKELGPRLSAAASIVNDPNAAPRASTYHAPRAGTIINVAEERDVVETVKYCVKNNIEFLTQSGGHGWATTFDIGDNDVVINMRGLNQITVDAANNQVTFGGGTLVGELKEAAYQNQVQTAIPTCDCVGMSGASLGGGFNMLMSRYGLALDNMLSINLVTAEGKLITVTPDSAPDLWWALRGAGANFGVVTSITMKTYPQVNNGMASFTHLVYSPDQLERLVQTLSDFDYTEEMYGFFYLIPSLPDFTPSIAIDLVYTGSAEAARAAFRAFYDIKPVSESTQELPFNEWGSLSAEACVKGIRTPIYTAGLKKMDPKTFREIWNEYTSFVSQNPGLSATIVAIQIYSPEAARELDDGSSAYPHRSINFMANITFLYVDARLDGAAEQFGKKIRKLLKKSSGFKGLKAYINYSHGDEDLEAIYGKSLCRLKNVKSKWDRNGRFSQFFAIPTRKW